MVAQFSVHSDGSAVKLESMTDCGDTSLNSHIKHGGSLSDVPNSAAGAATNIIPPREVSFEDIFCHCHSYNHLSGGLVFFEDYNRPRVRSSSRKKSRASGRCCCAQVIPPPTTTSAKARRTRLCVHYCFFLSSCKPSLLSSFSTCAALRPRTTGWPPRRRLRCAHKEAVIAWAQLS